MPNAELGMGNKDEGASLRSEVRSQSSEVSVIRAAESRRDGVNFIAVAEVGAGHLLRWTRVTLGFGLRDDS
jgi:hypothetical protein